MVLVRDVRVQPRGFSLRPQYDLDANDVPVKENATSVDDRNATAQPNRRINGASPSADGMSTGRTDETEHPLADPDREEGEINDEMHEDIAMDLPEPWGPGKMSASFDEPDPRAIDAMLEDETYGPHKWRPGTEMTWAQYQANARMFGDVAFQRTLPKHHRGPLPDRAVVNKNLQLQDYIAMAWVEHERKKPAAPTESRASPPPESQFSTHPYSGQSRTGTYPDSYYLEDADWFPYVSYWPNNVEPTFAIRANRVNAPPVPPPPNVPKKLRWDGRYGNHERTWLPQWGHLEEGLRHLAFIPIKRPRTPREFDLLKKEGGWYFAVHAEDDDDIAWFRVRPKHMDVVAKGLWRLKPAVVRAMYGAAKEVGAAWKRERLSIPAEQRAAWHKSAPTAKFSEFWATMAYLFCEGVSEWELRGALVAFQRILLQLRGWLAFSAALRKAQKTRIARRWGNHKAAHSDMQLMFGRRDSRGVFVLTDEGLARLYADYDVPVWLCMKYQDGFRLSLTGRFWGNSTEYYGSSGFTAGVTLWLREQGTKRPVGYMALAIRREEDREAAQSAALDKEVREEEALSKKKQEEWKKIDAAKAAEKAKRQAQVRAQAEKMRASASNRNAPFWVPTLESAVLMRPKSPNPTGASTSATQQEDDALFDHFFPRGAGTPPREQTPPPKPTQRAEPPTSHASPPAMSGASPPPAPSLPGEASTSTSRASPSRSTSPIPASPPASPGPSPSQPVVELAVQDANAPPISDANDVALVVALLPEGKTSVSDDPATDAGTAGGETVQEDKAPKRKEAPVGEEAKPTKKARGSTLKAALATMPDPKQFKGVKIRLTSFHEPDVDLPSWWPDKFAWPEEVNRTVDRTRARELTLAVCEMPVPAFAKRQKGIYKMPRLGYFKNAWATKKKETEKTQEHNISRSLWRWMQIRSYYIAKVSSDPIGNDDGFTADQWRKINKCLLLDAESYPIVKRLGLDVIHQPLEPPEIAEEEEGSSMQTEVPEMTLRQLLDSEKDKLYFDGHPVTPPQSEFDDSWLSLAWKRYLIWDISELEFRYEMLSLAMNMRRWYPNKDDLHEIPDIEYFNMVKECWSEGLEALKPTDTNWLCSSRPEQRIPAVRTFAQLMRTWPRAPEMLRAWDNHWDMNSPVPDMESPEYEDLERAVWHCYLQSYYDFRGRPAPLPYVRPPRPFADDSSL
ncbi:hypothetical protein AURDEDRAFT_172117 [Auricularia subglabra TFB-10046 SS5]|nr:hypothetical protein AURDEDRAFT_172117 [Auricularia subglabra TFB-10046 SS5]